MGKSGGTSALTIKFAQYKGESLIEYEIDPSQVFSVLGSTDSPNETARLVQQYVPSAASMNSDSVVQHRDHVGDLNQAGPGHHDDGPTNSPWKASKPLAEGVHTSSQGQTVFSRGVNQTCLYGAGSAPMQQMG